MSKWICTRCGIDPYQEECKGNTLLDVAAAGRMGIDLSKLEDQEIIEELSKYTLACPVDYKSWFRRFLLNTFGIIT